MSIIQEHKFRKSWGQNFITDNNLLEKIVRTVSPNKNDSILEIGPGGGALSKKMINLVKEMVAVEVDPLLVKYLNSLLELEKLKIAGGEPFINKSILHFLETLNLPQLALYINTNNSIFPRKAQFFTKYKLK